MIEASSSSPPGSGEASASPDASSHRHGVSVSEPTNPVPPRGPSHRFARLRRRGSGHQHAQRKAEQITRRRVADVGSHLVTRGWSWLQVASRLPITDRTLRRWRVNRITCRSNASLIGRPVARSVCCTRNEVIRFLDEHGPRVGVATLRECFPTMTRSELADLLRRYRRVWRRRNRVPLRVLTWCVPGRVWAIDFSGPMSAIDSRYPYLIAVRDVCTGQQLLWRPVEEATGEVARDALAALFAEHGPPLVLKSDNGSPFTGHAVQQLLKTHGVESLLSPPYWPAYNGAVEAGIGSLKDRTEASAARAGHPGYWTCDDVTRARLEANALARPNGENGPTPDEAWLRRTPVTDAERTAFRTAVEEMRITLDTCSEAEEAVTSEREVARSAIRLTLELRGYLQYRRRSIPPPIFRR